jgi:titin
MLYQTERAGNFSYNIPVSGGSQTYWVALKFAETTATVPGQRVFDVRVDGNLAVDNLDLHSAAGANTAFDVVMAVTSASDVLNIQLQTEAGSALPAKVNAIVVGAAQVLPPAAPAALTANAVSGTRIDLSWTDNSANETSFQLEVSTDGLNFAPLASVGANLTSYSHTGLAPATTYYYRVRACNTAGCSTFAADDAQTSSEAPPAAPSNLVATVQGGSQINLTWIDNSSNEQGFVIERSLNNSTWQVVFTAGPNVRNWSNTGLQSNTRYYYRVRAYNAFGSSANSNTVNVRTKQK